VQSLNGMIETETAGMDLTISIATLGRYPGLANCLRSLYQEDDRRLKFVVCIIYNGPGGDGICERIRSEFPLARLIERTGPLGFCAPHNMVLRQARSRYVLVLDDDTVIPRGTLPRMIAFMDGEPRAGMAGCKTLNPDASFQPTFGRHPSLGSEFAGIFGAYSPMPKWLYRDLSLPRDVDWLHGSFMLVRAEALAAAGAFDERYYTYICEYDWCYRIRLAGWRVMYVPDAEIIHVGGDHSINTSGTEAKSYSRIVHSYVNRFYFFDKHYGFWQALVLRPIVALQAIARLVFFSIAGHIRPGFGPIAKTRKRAFWRILRLCFSAEPHRLPSDIIPG
jgi:GT2 family glycosyltransferase